ncbi:MAG TPA: beta-phosphoglucomutase family hydrolase [Jiangellaceae bacterium]
MTTHAATLYLDRLAAVIFDLDGVVTDTAGTHARAWKRTFDEFLARYRDQAMAEQAPFDLDADYLRFVDGKPRLAGARAFLESRGIILPEGSAARRRGEESVESLAEQKTRYFIDDVQRNGVAAFPATVCLARDLRRGHIRTAVVSSSRNCALVLAAASVTTLFDVRVDGTDLERLHLPGKPEPDIFLEAARRLGTAAHRCAVVEDALAGVEAGRAGGFGVVIGVDRSGRHDGELYLHGAHVVVNDLNDVNLVDGIHERVAAGL